MGNETARRQVRHLAIANRCTVDWATMRGDGPVRFCGSCRQQVYNLSEMTEAQADELLAQGEERCVRYYHRPDGTIVTSACATGARRAPAVMAAGLATAIATTTAFVGISAVVDRDATAMRDDAPVQVAMGSIRLNIKLPTPEQEKERAEKRAKRKREREQSVADVKPSLAPGPAPAVAAPVVPEVPPGPAESEPGSSWPELGALGFLLLALAAQRRAIPD